MRKRIPTALAFVFILVVLFLSRSVADTSTYAIALFGAIATWEISRRIISRVNPPKK